MAQVWHLVEFVALKVLQLGGEQAFVLELHVYPVLQSASSEQTPREEEKEGAVIPGMQTPFFIKKPLLHFLQ
jgi:hypothetical protein